jgi:glutathione S-transferase
MDGKQIKGKCMLKIWGRINSSNVQKVMWTVAELGIEHERIDAGMAFGLVNEPWYREKNPNGRIPMIEDDGFVLWESNAIVRYLAAKYGQPRFYPNDLHVRADADRWMDWATSTVAPLMSPLFYGLIRTPLEQRNAKSIDEASVKMEECAAILNKHLTGRSFIAGDEFSMGDIPLGCFINRWYGLPLNRSHYDALADWYARLSKRPAFQQHVMLPLS